MQEITVEQSTQPEIGGVLVGIVMAGLKEGVPTARLLLRRADERRVADVSEGESVDLLGAGDLTVTSVQSAHAPGTRARVTLHFVAKEEAA